MPEVTASPTFFLAVVVGGPTFVKALPRDQPLLVIDADPQRSRQLSRELDGNGSPAVICTEVITAEEGGSVEWHHYNDARLDGPVGLAEWQHFYPNLQLLSKETRSGRLLKDLVQSWANEHAPDQLISLDLELRQGDPMATLISLGSWIQSVRSVRLEIPTPKETSESIVVDWLHKQGFQLTDDSTKEWKRNPLTTLELTINQQNQTITELENKLQELSRQRDEEQARAIDLAKELEHLNTEVNEILSLLDQSLGVVS
jgi:hypothetical protein